jgi:hypothetical protein
LDEQEQRGRERRHGDATTALRLAVSIEASVTSDAVEKVPTGRRADSL